MDSAGGSRSTGRGHFPRGLRTERCAHNSYVSLVNRWFCWLSSGPVSSPRAPRAPSAAETIVNTVRVTPSAGSLSGVGETVQLSAVALNGDGGEVADVQFEWQSSDALVAVVDQDGVVTAVSEGSTTVTATAQSISGVAAIETLGELVWQSRVIELPHMVEGVSRLNAIWAGTASQVIAVGDDGKIVEFDGVDWKGMNSPTTTSLSAVWGDSPTSVYAVGEGGVMLH